MVDLSIESVHVREWDTNTHTQTITETHARGNTYQSFFHFRFDITGEREKCLFNVGTCFSRGFNEFDSILDSQLFAALFCNLRVNETVD